MTICFATNNLNKLREIRQLLGDQFDIKSLSDIGCEEELPETGDTLEAISRVKARYVFDNYHVNCFADDTGLEVAYLNGDPGVYTARYAGEERDNNKNISLLLKNLDGIEHRFAQFKTIITLIRDGKVDQFDGVVGGDITHELHGEGGFGYDPIFRPTGYERTFAEMAPKEKNAISHRGLAIAKLVDFLKK
ncbi:MAG: RdgB/HAM1 family non-canonical purine NTP pyrophosphatase [Bacteroidota bacterium]